MKKEEFIELYNNLTIKELCKVLNCSSTLVYSLLRRYDIPKKYNKFKNYDYLKNGKKSKINLN